MSGLALFGPLLVLACTGSLDAPEEADRLQLFVVEETSDTLTISLSIPIFSSTWSVDGVLDESARDQQSYSVSKKAYAPGTHVVEASVQIDLAGDGDYETVTDQVAFTVQSSDPPPGETRVFETTITQGFDDAEERPSGRISRSSSDLEMALDLGRNTGDQQQVVGLRFAMIDVPRAAQIREARLMFTADETSSSASALTIDVELSSDAAPISSQQFDISARPKSNAVSWNPASWSSRGETHETPDLANLVQQIVDRADWSAGNAMLFSITGTGTRTAESFDGSVLEAARLSIEFDAPGSEPPPSAQCGDAACNDGESCSSCERDCGSCPPPGATNVNLPARGAFYYPWFPQTWTVNGSHVFYHPTAGYYSSDDTAVVDEHIAALDYAKVDVGIFSWWGVGAQNEASRIPLLLSRTQAARSDLKWAAYYEQEGFGNPSASQLQTELEYLKQNYASDNNYAYVDGKPVIFVYNADDLDCTVADKWAPFFAEWYVVLKVFPGYDSCANQPSEWHQYAPAAPVDHQVGHAYAVSPGFWRADEPSARLERDIDRWNANIRDMVTSNAPWQLVTTFNEWGEGTATESAQEWSSGRFGLYLDALATDGVGGANPPPPSSDGIVFGAAGDFGGKDDRAGTVMTDMLNRDLSAFFLLGDMSYSEITPEQAWCDWVHGYLGTNYPFSVIAGNHEEDSRVDGYIGEFAKCMPDRLGSDLGPGGYSVNFASDLGPVTMIGTAPDLVVAGVDYKYDSNSPERTWLVSTIRAAKTEGDWVVVGMHKNCITIGNKSCEIGEDFAQLLIDEGVDLVLQGHDHDYQRSHSLQTVVENSVGTIGDNGSDSHYARNAGTVFVVVGTAGRSMTTCSHGDSEYGNFAQHWCGEEATDTKGYLILNVGDTSLAAEFVSTAGTPFSDTFVIE